MFKSTPRPTGTGQLFLSSLICSLVLWDLFRSTAEYINLELGFCVKFLFNGLLRSVACIMQPCKRRSMKHALWFRGDESIMECCVEVRSLMCGNYRWIWKMWEPEGVRENGLVRFWAFVSCGWFFRDGEFKPQRYVGIRAGKLISKCLPIRVPTSSGCSSHQDCMRNRIGDGVQDAAFKQKHLLVHKK